MGYLDYMRAIRSWEAEYLDLDYELYDSNGYRVEPCHNCGNPVYVDLESYYEIDDEVYCVECIKKALR